MQPNILLILTDQQRLDTLAARHSNFPAKTPHIDKLLRHAAFFDNAYCTSPVCSPSRASIMTGQHPSQTGVYSLIGNPCGPMNEKNLTIGHRMQSLGYQTAYHGKWHLGGNPSTHGFEIAYENSHDASTTTEAARFWRNRDWLVYKRPFFHIVSFLNPHDIYFLDPEDDSSARANPWPNQSDDLTKKPWPQKVQQANWSPERWHNYRQFYARKLEEVDTQIGLLIDELIDSGFGPNTWIILTTDHGDMAGEHSIPFKGPFMYEGVTRVPLLIIPPQERFTGKDKRGLGDPNFAPHTCNHLTSLTDLVPTILDLAGAPADPTLPGISLLPAVLKQPFTAHEAIFAEWHQFGKIVSPIRMIRSGDWKYNLYLHNGAELYNLQSDPHELTNLANDPAHAATQKSLHQKLLHHLRSTKDPFFTYTPTNAAGEPFCTAPESDPKISLRGSVLRYDDPFEPAVPPEDWEALQ